MSTVLITGAAKGIGAQTARLFAKAGYNVVINYLTSEKQAVALADQLNAFSYAAAIKADVSDAAQVKALFNEATARFGNVDVLVCNAAVSTIKLFGDLTAEEWRRTFAVNVDGIFNCCQAALPSMLSRKKGKIITVASMWGEVGASCETHYSSSKAAVIGLTKALAKEVAPSGITVNCVSPGCIDTDMNACHSAETLKELAEETPLGRLGTTDDVAEAILFLASDKADFITGQVLGVNGGFVI